MCHSMKFSGELIDNSGHFSGRLICIHRYALVILSGLIADTISTHYFSKDVYDSCDISVAELHEVVNVLAIEETKSYLILELKLFARKK